MRLRPHRRAAQMAQGSAGSDYHLRLLGQVFHLGAEAQNSMSGLPSWSSSRSWASMRKWSRRGSWPRLSFPTLNSREGCPWLDRPDGGRRVSSRASSEEDISISCCMAMDNWDSCSFSIHRQGAAPRPVHQEPECSLPRLSDGLSFDGLCSTQIISGVWHVVLYHTTWGQVR